MRAGTRCNTSQILKRGVRNQNKHLVFFIHGKLLFGFQVQMFSDRLRDHDLIFTSILKRYDPLVWIGNAGRFFTCLGRESSTIFVSKAIKHDCGKN